MKTIKVFTVIGLLGLLTTFSFSFTWSQVSGEDEWTTLKTSNEIEVFYKVTECEGTWYYLFKVVNDSKIIKVVQLEIDITNEPAYGPIIFEEELAPGESSGESCLSDIKLPKMSDNSDNLHNNIKITFK